LLMIVALPALDVSKNCVKPPAAALNAPPLLVKTLELPAVALLVNRISPPRAVTKFCAIPELFMMPAPLIVSFNPELAVIV
jgi:hypothetical protein